MAIEKAIDQMQITGPATAGADRKLTGQMRLGGRRKGSNLLVPDMHPLVVPSSLKAPLAPFPSEEMTSWPVSARVGNVEKNDPSLIEPIAA